jgi:hypothetical protein
MSRPIAPISLVTGEDDTTTYTMPPRPSLSFFFAHTNEIFYVLKMETFNATFRSDFLV